MGRVEWLRWVVHYGRPQTRAQQIRIFLAFEFYYQLCKLRGYKVDHILEMKSLSAGRYILLRPPLPLSIKLLDKIFSFGRDAHAKFVPYTPEVEEEMRRAGKRIEMIEISYKFGIS